jgi:hypothetical protein
MPRKRYHLLAYLPSAIFKDCSIIIHDHEDEGVEEAEKRVCVEDSVHRNPLLGVWPGCPPFICCERMPAHTDDFVVFFVPIMGIDSRLGRLMLSYAVRNIGSVVPYTTHVLCLWTVEWNTAFVLVVITSGRV